MGEEYRNREEGKELKEAEFLRFLSVAAQWKLSDHRLLSHKLSVIHFLIQCEYMFLFIYFIYNFFVS